MARLGRLERRTPPTALVVTASIATLMGAVGGVVVFVRAAGDGAAAGAHLPGRSNASDARGQATAARSGGPSWRRTLTPVGAALREVFESEPVDLAWTQETRDQLAPLFSGGFELECHASWCALENTFENAAAFRDFTETLFAGRAPAWRGPYVLGTPLPGATAKTNAPMHAVLFLGDRRRAGATAVAGEAAPVQLTSGTRGEPAAKDDARGWSKRAVVGTPDGIMQNASPSDFRDLRVRLAGSTATAGGAPLGSWRVFVSVGGPDLAARPPRCAIQQDATLSALGTRVLVASSGPETYDATYDASIGTIALFLPAAAETGQTYVRCSVPPQGWIGNITWQHTALGAPGQASRRPAPMDRNSEG